MLDLEVFSLSNTDTHKHAKTIKYKGREVFCNENPKAQNAPKVPWSAVYRYYKNFPKNAKPKRNIPFVMGDFFKVYTTPSLSWLGHSSLFFTYEDLRLLVDPLFTTYASPFFFLNQAFREAKIFKASQFPPLSATILTHAHYDHLDKKSVLALKEQTTYFICPLKVGMYLQKWGISRDRIVELDWWDGVRLRTDRGELSIIATPSQHNSKRLEKIPANSTLWASFVLEFRAKEGRSWRIFLSADGGYYKHFKVIGETFLGFDLCALESGQYNTAWQYSHSFPNEILKEAQDLKARAVLPIHWGRFVAGTHGWNEVVKFLKVELKKLSIPCLTPKMGQIYTLGEALEEDFWWEEE